MTTVDGYRVTPSALTDGAADLNGQASQLNTIAGQINGTTLAAAVFGQLPQSAQVAQTHDNTVTSAGQATTKAAQRTTTLATGLTNSANGYTQADEQVAGFYQALLNQGASVHVTGPTGQQTSGPFASQIAANRTKVASALTDEQRNQTDLNSQLAQLQAEDQRYPVDDYGRPVNSYQESQLAQQITQSQQRISLYQSILANNRQIISFDPSGNGHIAELIGTIGPNTQNVGVLVPGTGTDMANFDDYAKDAASFVQADPSGHLAMVTWANGTSPQSLIPSAADPGYARQSAPDLASFSHQLRDQINQNAGPDNNVQVTYAGHSYGSAVVGLAEQDGLDANRVLSIEGAGMGHDVWSPSDLHDTQLNVARYAMTAPNDPIGYIQGVQAFGMGHGAAPDTFPGTVDLATGNYPNGQPITGLPAHNGVFTVGSDAWQNMYGVFTGGKVTPAPPPQPQMPFPLTP